MWVATVPPPARGPCRARSGRRPRSRPRRRSPRSPSATAGKPIGFLDAQFLEPAHARRAFGKGAATARIGYSSIIDGARSAGTSTPLSADARTRKSAISSPTSLRRSSVFDVGAHLAQRRDQAGAQRIGHDAVSTTSEPGTISAATSGNAAEDGSAGTTTGAGASSGSPFKRDPAAVRAFRLDA